MTKKEIEIKLQNHISGKNKLPIKEAIELFNLLKNKKEIVFNEQQYYTTEKLSIQDDLSLVDEKLDAKYILSNNIKNINYLINTNDKIVIAWIHIKDYKRNCINGMYHYKCVKVYRRILARIRDINKRHYIKIDDKKNEELIYWKDINYRLDQTLKLIEQHNKELSFNRYSPIFVSDNEIDVLVKQEYKCEEDFIDNVLSFLDNKTII